MSEPWRDPERYKTGRLVKCLGCGASCHKSPWGAWCYACNVERIDRISGFLESEVARHKP